MANSIDKGNPPQKNSYNEQLKWIRADLVSVMRGVASLSTNFFAKSKESDARISALEQNPRLRSSNEISTMTEDLEDSKEMDEAPQELAVVEEELDAEDEVDDNQPPAERSLSPIRGRSSRKNVEESSDSDIEDDKEEPNSPLAKRDVRILKNTSGNWVRPNVHFEDGSNYNTFNHRIFLFGVGSVVRGWNRGDSVEVVRRDTWTGIDPYLLTNQRTGSSVSGHSW